MKIQYASDLHLEFSDNKNYLKKHPLKPCADILVLAGDIMTFRSIGKNEDFFDKISDDFKTIYWLPGNHEYYHSDLSLKYGHFNEKIRDNLFLVNNSVVKTDAYCLIFTTLWSHIHPPNELYVKSRLNDFHLISFQDDALTVPIYNQLHLDSLSFLKNALQEIKDRKTVVVTHHVPTYQNYPDMYKSSPLNDAFTVELSSLITEMQPDVWIYGHSHYNTPVFKIGNTLLTSNQLGYVHMGEHKDFKPHVTV